MDEKVINKYIQKVKPFLPKHRPLTLHEIGNARIKQTFNQEFQPNKESALKNFKKNPSDKIGTVYLDKKQHTINRILGHKNGKLKIGTLPMQVMITGLKQRADFKLFNRIFAKKLNHK